MKVKSYLVRRGDTLGAIAAAFQISLEELLDENPQILNPNYIRTGEFILIPDQESKDSIHRVISERNDPSEIPLWLKIAQREEGVTEVKGSGSNPRILEYHASTTLNRKHALQDSTAWCSSFANWCIENSGTSGTDSAWALDWHEWGNKLAIPRIGCIAVFSRKGLKIDGGHVGFFIGESESSVEILGGNQGNSVSRARFPKSGKKGDFTYELLGYRWPKGL